MISNKPSKTQRRKKGPRKPLTQIGSDCLMEIFQFYIQSSTDLLTLSHINSECRQLVNNHPFLWNCKIKSKCDGTLYFNTLRINRGNILERFIANNNEGKLGPSTIGYQSEETLGLIDMFSKKNGGRFNGMICHTDELVHYWEYEEEVKKDLKNREFIYSNSGIVFEWIQRLFIIAFCIYGSLQEHVEVMKTALALPIYSWILYADYPIYLALLLEPLLMCCDIFMIAYYSEFVPSVKKGFGAVSFDTFRRNNELSTTLVIISFLAGGLLTMRLLIYFTYDPTRLSTRQNYYTNMERENATFIELFQLFLFNGEELFRATIRIGNLALSPLFAIVYVVIARISGITNTLFSFGVVMIIQLFLLVFLNSWMTPLIALIISVGAFIYNRESWFVTLMLPFTLSLLFAYLGLEPFYIYSPYLSYYMTCRNVGQWKSYFSI